MILLNCCVGEDSWESLDSKDIQPVHPKGKQCVMFIGRIHILVPILPQIPSHPGCHITLKSFLCYTVDPCWLFILNIALSDFDINVIVNQWKDLGSIPFFSVFWETLFKTDMFRFLETGCIFFTNHLGLVFSLWKDFKLLLQFS